MSYFNAANPSAARYTGKVKFFLEEKGWGFISPDDGGPEVFVHKADLRQSLVVNQCVSFEIVETTKGNGKKATNVELI